MIKVMTVFGTRPEAIKMAPVVKTLQRRKETDCLVCVTGQHREMLDQVLDAFDIIPQYDLDIMEPKQTLVEITINTLERLSKVIKEVKPDMILVHGDTTTTLAASLAAFYHKTPIGHIEAGLRTANKYSPYPEEVNRQMVGVVADIHFAPTEESKQNLINEQKNEETIIVTGNTAIDALKNTIKPHYFHPILESIGQDKIILLTAHRRENLGEPLRQIFKAVNRLVYDMTGIQVVFPVHLNPSIQSIAKEVLGDNPKIHLIEPLDVIDFHNFLDKSYLVLTDSGGIQEEAPALGKPVLVLRDTTERPEGVEAGTLKLVGTDEQVIYDSVKLLLTNTDVYQAMSQATNPYGDGTASTKIVDYIINYCTTKHTQNS